MHSTTTIFRQHVAIARDRSAVAANGNRPEPFLALLLAALFSGRQ